MKQYRHASQNHNRKKPRPSMKWQTGDYERFAEFRFTLPYPFLLLCKIMEVTPEALLADFMNDLCFNSWQREGREKAREKLMEYFLERGYGQQHYSADDIRTLFKEMDALGLLWPRNANMKLVEMHEKWRDEYQSYWFKKWYWKNRRTA